jgi:hypothetical protein
MKFRNPKKKIIEKINDLEYDYRFDQKEFGKIMIVASLSLLVVSVHSLYTINGAVEQASNSTERLDTSASLISSDSFQQSMQSLAATGATIDGQGIDQLIADLEYATSSLSEVEELSNSLENAQTTYQWTVLIGMLGMVVGITSIYI